jgi:hypothetical protein
VRSLSERLHAGGAAAARGRGGFCESVTETALNDASGRELSAAAVADALHLTARSILG